jgi:DnaJ-class molecular chaperone
MSPTNRSRTFYEVLGVDVGASQDEVRHAYRSKVLLCHPDLRHAPADPAEFRHVRRAYEVLANPAERKRYDQTLGIGEYAGRARFQRRRFDHLFDSLFRRLRVAVDVGIRLVDSTHEERRRAG